MQIPTRWNADGSVDSWEDRIDTVFKLPVSLLVKHNYVVFVFSKDLETKEGRDLLWGFGIWIAPTMSILCEGAIYVDALGKPMTILPCLIGTLLIFAGRVLFVLGRFDNLWNRMKWIKNHAEKGKAACRLLGNVWVVGGILASLTSFLSEELSVFVLQGLVLVSAILLIGIVSLFGRGESL